jgi:hypothetical protein
MPVRLHMRALQITGAEGDLTCVASEGMRRLNVSLGWDLGRHGESWEWPRGGVGGSGIWGEEGLWEVRSKSRNNRQIGGGGFVAYMTGWEAKIWLAGTTAITKQLMPWARCVETLIRRSSESAR